MPSRTYSPTKVVFVRQDVMIGAHALSTLSGNMMVDGLLASSYVFMVDQGVAPGLFCAMSGITYINLCLESHSTDNLQCICHGLSHM